MTTETDDWYGPEAATFGDRLAAARDESGMTQTDLAKRLGVKLSTVKGWEQDTNEPRANRLSMMAGLLNVSMSWLITGTGNGLDAPVEEVEISSDMKGVLLEIRELQVQLKVSAERLGRLDKKLRQLIKEPSK